MTVIKMVGRIVAIVSIFIILALTTYKTSKETPQQDAPKFLESCKWMYKSCKWMYIDVSLPSNVFSSESDSELENKSLEEERMERDIPEWSLKDNVNVEGLRKKIPQFLKDYKKMYMKGKGHYPIGIGGLALTRDRRLIPAYCDLAKNAEDPAVRIAAAGAIGSLAGLIGRESAISCLRDLLKDENEMIAVKAAHSLIDFQKYKEAEKAFIELYNSKDAAVRSWAVSGLIDIERSAILKISGIIEIEVKLSKEGRDVLKRALNDEDETIRSNARYYFKYLDKENKMRIKIWKF